jgi:hypothetical protein
MAHRCFVCSWILAALAGSGCAVDHGIESRAAGGDGGGAALTGGSAGAGGTGGGGGTAGAKCFWGAAGIDPAPGPLSCDRTVRYFQVDGKVEGAGGAAGAGTVALSFQWCGCSATSACFDRGAVSTLSLAVPPELGTLEAFSGVCSGFTHTTATIALASGATEGDVVLTGSISGQDQCHQPLTCPIDHTYHVAITGSGVEVTPNAGSTCWVVLTC